MVVSGKANKLSEIWQIFNQSEHLRKIFFKDDYLV